MMGPWPSRRESEGDGVFVDEKDKEAEKMGREEHDWEVLEDEGEDHTPEHEEVVSGSGSGSGIEVANATAPQGQGLGACEFVEKDEDDGWDEARLAA